MRTHLVGVSRYAERVTLETRRQTLGQVLVCMGCCCGRTDKGKPGIPVEWLKAEWKKGGLLKHVHLTIGGCLGPCEIPNVVAVVRPDGTEWFGLVDGDHYYAALLAWARESAACGVLLPVPALFEPHRFERYRPVTVAEAVNT